MASDAGGNDFYEDDEPIDKIMAIAARPADGVTTMPVSDYRPFDQDKWLPAPPWKPDLPALVAWEAAHGHDVRMKCYPEFGCLAIGYENDALHEEVVRLREEAESLMARVAQLEADAREQSEVASSSARGARKAGAELAYALRREANKAAAFDEASGRTQAEGDLLREELRAAEGKINELTTEAEEYHQLTTRQGDLLTGVANALRGDPPPLTWWDHSDLPTRAAAMKASRDDAVTSFRSAREQIGLAREMIDEARALGVDAVAELEAKLARLTPETVGRSICSMDLREWDDLHDTSKENYRRIGKAVIAALEPPDGEHP